MSFFKDKVVWITGASSGIGERIVYLLDKYEAKIIISARRKAELGLIKAKCKNYHNIMVLPLDLAEHDSIEEKTKSVIDKFGKIDILINNAGIGQRGLIKDTSIDVDKKIMAVNYIGTVALTKSVLNYMIKENNGHIATITSLVGKYGTPYRSSYAASKHALHGFFESLRAEIKENNINISLICPGVVKTEITSKALSENGSAHGIPPKIPTGIGIEPEICAKDILKAIEKNKSEILSGGPEIISVYFKRFFPKTFSKIISKVRTT